MRPITRYARELDLENMKYIPVPVPASETDSKMNGIIDFVWENYRQYSALQLSDMTHKDKTPWKKPGIKIHI